MTAPTPRPGLDEAVEAAFRLAPAATAFHHGQIRAHLTAAYPVIAAAVLRAAAARINEGSPDDIIASLYARADRIDKGDDRG